ncbi:hypothetical protein FOL47_004582 [Perkinsus chesapeaki]|uniref:Uncharacterized protein n=1 Tax=Perkinsus chesapeaki TaxID=330153 RepID=A0A7J6MZ25_PERCH|nr:hypothetical protein FOL47_004582 [Perkinsus chesapeaki]
MTNPNTFPGEHLPFSQGVPYPRPEEMYSPYAWPTTPFPGGFGLPPGPNYDDNPAWAQFRQAMAHPASTPVVPDAARKRTDELLERLSEERRELLARFPPLTPSSVGSHLRRTSSNGFATPLPNRMDAPVPGGYPRGGFRQSTGQALNAIPEEDGRGQAVVREMPSFGGGRGGMEARSPEDRAVAVRRYSNAFADRSPARRSTIDHFLHNVGERGPRRSLSAEGRVEGAQEDKENDNSGGNEGSIYSQQPDQTARFGASKEARTVSPSTRRRSSISTRPTHYLSRGTGTYDIRDVHAMCCDACPCKGGKLLCCEHCSLKGHMGGEGKGEMKETACNTEWEGSSSEMQGAEGMDNGAMATRGIMRRKRPRHSSPVDSDRGAEEDDVCQHIGPWHGKVPPKPSAPKDLRVPERLSKVDRRRGERARRKTKAAATAPYEPQQPQLNQSSQISNGSAFQSLVEEAEEATAAAAGQYRNSERVHDRDEREHGRHHHYEARARHHREHRQRHGKAERGVPRRGGSLSSNDDLEAHPHSEIEESYDHQADFEAQEIQRTERRRYSEARRQDEAGLIRTGRVDEHRGVDRGESFEDPDETARHLSFDDASFDAIPEEEPDNINSLTYHSDQDDDTLSAIHPSVDGGHRASETVSFGRQQRESVKMVNTSLQVGPELASPVKAKRKTRGRKHRDPESSDGTLVEEFRESPSYGRGAPRSTRRPPLDVLKGEKILYKRTNSGHGFVIGTLTRHKHDKGMTSRESRSSLEDHVPSRERSRGNRASQESYDPNQSLVPTNSLTYDEVSGLLSEKSPPPLPGRKKGAGGDKKGKKKGTVSRSKAPQAKAKSRAARKKTGVINAKRGAQKVAAAKVVASKNSAGEGRRQDREGGWSSEQRKEAAAEVPHARRDGGPRHTYALPGENWWRSDGTDSAIPADYKLVGYKEDRLLEYHSNMKCLVPLDSPQFMPVLLQLAPYQQKIPETVSDGKSVYFFILECGDGTSNVVDEYPIMVHYENKQRLLGTGDSFIVGPGITYSIENDHATRDAKILMLLRHDTLENSGLNSEIEA